MKDLISSVFGTSFPSSTFINKCLSTLNLEDNFENRKRIRELLLEAQEIINSEITFDSSQDNKPKGITYLGETTDKWREVMNKQHDPFKPNIAYVPIDPPDKTKKTK